MNLRYLSVFSGVEAATQAWHPLGWLPWAFAEIEPFPAHVLNHHYGSGRPHHMPDPREPDIDAKEQKKRRANIKAVAGLEPVAFGGNAVPNLGDVTKFEEWPDATFDVLAGGTPCQSYSIAGLRAGLDDPRGDLMLTYVAIARRYRPKICVWENVPGVLSDDGGRSFGTLLGLLTGKRIEVPAGGWRTAGFVEGYKSAYGVAWRVLDSQFVRVDGFGRAVPQRRRRVFLVGYLGDWRRAAAILFERESMSGNPPPRRQPGQNVAGAINASAARRGGVNEGERGGLIPEGAVCPPLTGNPYGDHESREGLLVPEVPPPVRAGANETGGDRPHGTDVDTVESLIAVAGTLDAAGGRNRGAGINPGRLVAFGGNNCQGAIDVATARQANSSPTGRLDFESETFLVVPFDTTQLTNPDNRSQPQPGSPCHPLAAGGHPPAVALAFDSKASGRNGFGIGEISPTLRAMSNNPGTHDNGGGQVAVAFQPRFARNGRGAPDEVAAPLTAEAGRTGKGDSAQCVAFSGRMRGDDGRGYDRPPVASEEVCGTIDTVKPWNVATAWQVRRLTPTECERLQGMADGYTNVPWRGSAGAPDGPRYRALGNSMSVNVMRWLGVRIEMMLEGTGHEILRISKI